MLWITRRLQRNAIKMCSNQLSCKWSCKEVKDIHLVMINTTDANLSEGLRFQCLSGTTLGSNWQSSLPLSRSGNSLAGRAGRRKPRPLGMASAASSGSCWLAARHAYWRLVLWRSLSLRQSYHALCCGSAGRTMLAVAAHSCLCPASDVPTEIVLCAFARR